MFQAKWKGAAFFVDMTTLPSCLICKSHLCHGASSLMPIYLPALPEVLSARAPAVGRSVRPGGTVMWGEDALAD